MRLITLMLTLLMSTGALQAAPTAEDYELVRLIEQHGDNGNVQGVIWFTAILEQRCREDSGGDKDGLSWLALGIYVEKAALRANGFINDETGKKKE